MRFVYLRQAFSILLCALLAAACSTTKRISPADPLYDGATLVIEGEGEKEGGALKTELAPLLRPRPNAKILGWRWKLWFYNLADSPRDGRGVGRFLARRFGEPPVLASEVNLPKNRDVLISRLQNNGYFQAVGRFDTTVKDKTMRATYTLATGPQYFIDTVRYIIDSSAIGRAIKRTTDRRAPIRPGQPYSLAAINAEYTRLDARLKNRGFYYFSPLYFITDADTTVGNHRVALDVRLEESTPYKAKQVYRIRDVVIYPNYDLTRPEDTMASINNASLVDGYHIIDPEQRFKPRLFTTNLAFKPGDRYNRRDHGLSLSRLQSLGVFKFVKADFREVDTADNARVTDSTGHYLDAYYYATPQAFKSLRAEITGLTRSNNATGSELTLSWRHRNAFRAAELVTVSTFFGAENQVSGQQNIAMLRYGANASISVPRLISPFKHPVGGEFIPRTRFALGYEFFNRTTQYTLTSAQAQYGYQWKRRLEADHSLTLVNLALVDSSNVSEEFRRRLLTDVTLRRSIARQAIVGSIYNYTYSSLARPNRQKHNFYFNGNLDGSANLIGAVTGKTFGGSDAAQDPIRVLNTPLSQYIRAEVEGRHYLRLSRDRANPGEWQLVSRLLLGAAYAYGNSTEVPFVKQFFAGGVNSIRAFRARSLGPGTFYGGYAPTTNPDPNAPFFLPDQPGDARLEINTELRFKIIAVVKGAVFVDAGNIWTLRDDPARPGSKLTGEFLNQLAVGTGAGIRVDVGFIVARLDLATPIRKPYLQGGPNFVFDQIDFSDRAYRRENLILNLAIGYPF